VRAAPAAAIAAAAIAGTLAACGAAPSKTPTAALVPVINVPIQYGSSS
jgi:hypothetical protein